MSSAVKAFTLFDTTLTGSEVASTEMGCGQKDQVILYFVWTPTESPATLNFGLEFDHAVDTAAAVWHDETVESINTTTGLSTRVRKTNEYLENLGAATAHRFEVAVPVGENFCRVNVWETVSTVKGTLELKAIANTIGS